MMVCEYCRVVQARTKVPILETKKMKGASMDKRPWSEGQTFMAWACTRGSWSRNKKGVSCEHEVWVVNVAQLGPLNFWVAWCCLNMLYYELTKRLPKVSISLTKTLQASKRRERKHCKNLNLEFEIIKCPNIRWSTARSPEKISGIFTKGKFKSI